MIAIGELAYNRGRHLAAAVGSVPTETFAGMAPGQDGPVAPLPRILVVIPTRDRPVDLARCLESLALVAYPSWDPLVVDQSDDDASGRLVETYRDRLPALTYQRTPERGLCRARNLALERAGTGIVAYLSDDCTVGAAWLTDVAAAFNRHPSATLAFGSLYAAPYDSRQVVVPSIVFDRERELCGPFRHAELGMGASMYLWPARSLRCYRFDVCLGAGARWPAADERGYACRVLLAGEPVVLTPAIQVQHHGARSWAHGVGGKLLRGYLLADGAMDMKMIRCGDVASVWRALNLLRLDTARPLAALITVQRASGPRQTGHVRAWPGGELPAAGGPGTVPLRCPEASAAANGTSVSVVP